jgi:hypothetical protein
VHNVVVRVSKSVLDDADEERMGARVKRPQATNAASAAGTRLMAITFASPLMMWNGTASTMMIARPTAAMGVSFGAMRVADGSTSPSAPASSAMPMNRARPTGTPRIHGEDFAASWMGAMPWLKPAMRKNSASRA